MHRPLLLVLAFLVGGVGAVACGSTTFSNGPNDDGGTDGSTGDGSIADGSNGDAANDAGANDAGSSDAAVGPLAIVAGQNNPHDLIVSGGQLYWTNYGESSGLSSVYTAHTDGSGATPIATATHANRIASDGTSVFFTDFVSANATSSIVARVGIVSKAYSVIDSNALAPMGIAVDATSVYFVEGYGQGVGFLSADAKDASDGGSIATNLVNPVSIAVDQFGLGFTEQGTSPAEDQALFSNLAAEVMGGVGNLDNAWGVTLTASTGYFTVLGDPSGANGSVQRCQRNITSTTPDILTTSSTRPYFITNDGTNLYWTEEGVGASDGSVRWMSISSSAAVTVTTLADHQARPHGIAVDGAYVYWTSYSDGKIYRIAKP